MPCHTDAPSAPTNASCSLNVMKSIGGKQQNLLPNVTAMRADKVQFLPDCVNR
jgi:hypothetical protein